MAGLSVHILQYMHVNDSEQTVAHDLSNSYVMTVSAVNGYSTSSHALIKVVP